MKVIIINNKNILKNNQTFSIKNIFLNYPWAKEFKKEVKNYFAISESKNRLYKNVQDGA